jgi:hypothetical protein
MVAPINPTALTPPRVEFIDPRTGAISREWYRFFLSLLTATQTSQQETSTSPDASSLLASYDAMLAALTQEAQTAPDAASAISSLDDKVNDLSQAFGVTPPPLFGTVTSVDVSGGATGLTFSGGPITTSGTIVMAGTLGVGSGGTGLTAAPANGQLLIGNGTNYTLSTLTAGTGISVSNGAGSVTITNTAPDQIVSLTAGTAISITGTYPSFTITNTAPDQIVSLTGAGTTSISGTYPNFTITSNDAFVGTVTSVSGTGTVNGITLTGTVTSSGSLTLGGTLSGVDLTTQVTGTLPVGNGGTGATTLTGYVKGNGTSAFTASATVPASDVTGLATVATSGSFADLTNKPGIRSNGQNVIAATTTLGAGDKGTNILVVTSGITITFPSSGYASGEGVAISNISGGNVTFSFPGGSDIGTTFPNNGTLLAFCDGGGFWRQYCYSSVKL